MPDVLDPLPDEETIYRRVPRWKNNFSPPDHVTTANFKLKEGEEGLSVYQASIRTPESVLSVPEAPVGAFLLRVSVNRVRTLRNSEGKETKLDVLDVPREGDPGHAEIRRTTEPAKFSRSVTKTLRDLFEECLQDGEWHFGPTEL